MLNCQLHLLQNQTYEETWDFQRSLFDAMIQNKSNQQTTEPLHLIMIEHPHVYTFGKSADRENLLATDEALTAMEAKVYDIERGGDITYHGPGQIVCYPILDLDNFFTDVHKYLRFLEETIILSLRDYGIKGERSENETGVWLDVNTSNPRKICALGVKASRWVTMHGLALNVNNDLSYFNDIVPCGIKDKSVTSISIECKKNIEENFLKEKIIKNFLKLFSATKKV